MTISGFITTVGYINHWIIRHQSKSMTVQPKTKITFFGLDGTAPKVITRFVRMETEIAANKNILTGC